jgi:hypothetical protein
MSSASASASTKPAAAKKVVSKKEEVVAPAPAPVVAAPVAAPVAAKGKKAAASASAAPVAAVAAPVAAPVVSPFAAAAAAAEEEVRLEAEVKFMTARLLAVRETVSELISEAKRLEKKATKVQKLADKRRRRKVENEEGKPARVSIFQIPTDITPELCAFMGRPAGSQESRSNVTKFITTYVKEKNLKNKHDITADAALLKLLNLTSDVKLTYFNLQKYLNVHYVKKAPVA